MSQYDVDLFVIGGGSGGVRAARIAAGHGARVMLAEEYRVGGTCVIRGCVPKKLLVYASRFPDAFEDAAGFGWQVGESRFDWPSLIAAKDKEIARLEGLYVANLDRSGVEIVRSRAMLEGPNAVRIAADGRVVTARHILIATGASTVREPAVPGIEHAITSNEAFDLKRQPARILVVGGGYIAVEFAGIFAGLGSKVTLAHRGEHILRGFDDDIRGGLQDAYRHRGIDLRLKATLTRIDRTPSGLQVTFSDGDMQVYDEVMIATGRRPNIDGLGLEKAGVVVEGGAIRVDAASQTSAPSIHAVGDVTNRANLTPVAIREGHAFADSVFGGKDWTASHALIPTAVFSTPEIGSLGFTEAAARETGKDVSIFMSAFRPMMATLSGRNERTIMKLVVEKQTDLVIGVHILGDHAGEIIQMAGVALTLCATKADFDRTMAVHPTAAEELVTMRAPVR